MELYKNYWGNETRLMVEHIIDDFDSDYENIDKLKSIYDDDEKLIKLLLYVANKMNNDTLLWERITDALDYYINEYVGEK